MYSKCNVKKCEDILRIKLQKHFDLIQDVTMVSLKIEVIMKLVILAYEHSLYFGFRVEFYKQVFGLAMGHLSPVCWQISSWNLLKPPPYTVLGSLLVSGADLWMLSSAFGKTV